MSWSVAKYGGEKEAYVLAVLTVQMQTTDRKKSPHEIQTHPKDEHLSNHRGPHVVVDDAIFLGANGRNDGGESVPASPIQSPAGTTASFIRFGILIRAREYALSIEVWTAGAGIV